MVMMLGDGSGLMMIVVDDGDWVMGDSDGGGDSGLLGRRWGRKGGGIWEGVGGNYGFE